MGDLVRFLCLSVTMTTYPARAIAIEPSRLPIKVGLGTMASLFNFDDARAP